MWPRIGLVALPFLPLALSSALALHLAVLPLEAHSVFRTIAVGIGADSVTIVAGAIVVGCTAIGLGLSRLGPHLSTFILNVGSALAQVKERFDATDRRLEELRHRLEESRAEADRKVAAAAAEAARLRRQLAEAEAKNGQMRHKLPNDLQAQQSKIDFLEDKLEQANARISRLKARQGLTDHTHADAINSVSDSVYNLAVRVDAPPPEHVHLDPLSEGSDVDIGFDPAALDDDDHPPDREPRP